MLFVLCNCNFGARTNHHTQSYMNKYISLVPILLTLWHKGQFDQHWFAQS